MKRFHNNIILKIIISGKLYFGLNFCPIFVKKLLCAATIATTEFVLHNIKHSHFINSQAHLNFEDFFKVSIVKHSEMFCFEYILEICMAALARVVWPLVTRTSVQSQKRRAGTKTAQKRKEGDSMMCHLVTHVRVKSHNPVGFIQNQRRTRIRTSQKTRRGRPR